MHMASIYILSQKTGWQRLSSYQLYSPWTVYFLKRTHSIIKGYLMVSVQMKTCGRWEVCLADEKLETPASCFSLYGFSSALVVSSFPLHSGELLSSPYPHLPLQPMIPWWLCKQPGSPVWKWALSTPPPLYGRDGEAAAFMAGREGQPLCLTAAPKFLTKGSVCPKADNTLKKLSMLKVY